MVVDFGQLSVLMKPILEKYLDHRDLNETLPLESPTCEAIARWLYVKLEQSDIPVVSVTVEETCTSACTYSETPRRSEAASRGL